MTPLPNDCARCWEPGDCPLRKTFRRTTPARGEAWALPYTKFTGGKDCPGYWPERNE